MSSVQLFGSLTTATSEEPQFTCFSKLPQEIRLLIWRAALPGPRVVGLTMRSLSKTIGEWEDENNATWPVLNGKVIHKSPAATAAANSVNVPEPESVQSFPYDDERECARIRSRLSDVMGGDYRDCYLQGFSCNTPLPAMLLSCQESHDVALKSYTKAFASPHSSPETFFSFERDTLYLRYEDMSSGNWAEDGIRGLVSSLTGGFRFDGIKDVHRVQRLAISLPAEEERLLYMMLVFLLRIFACLEKLTLVVKHFRYKYHEDSNEEIVLIGPLEVNSASLEWNQYGSHGLLIDVETRKSIGLHSGHADVDMVELGVKLKDANESDSQKRKMVWNLPQIEIKIAVPGSVSEELKVAKSNC